MATKKAATTTPRIPRSKLKPTDLEGVYHTTDGRRVDAHGVDLDFKSLKKRDAARFTEVIGKDVESPADLLKAVALDPRNSLERRIDAAHKAAPYFSPKLVAVQGVAGGPAITMANLSDMSPEQLNAYEAALKAAALAASGVKA